MNNDLTELIVILDASGSMGKRKQDVIGGFNQLIDDQRREPGDCFVTVVQFSSFGRQKIIVDRKSVHKVAYLTNASYQTIGWTALYDAMATTIDDVGSRLADLPEWVRPGKVIVAVITDGEENNSREYTVDQVCSKVTHQRDVYSWEFLFVGANQDAILAGRALGVADGLSATYVDTADGYRRAFRGISYGVSSLRCGNDESAKACMADISGDEDVEKVRREKNAKFAKLYGG
jgi:hypothetical protein